MLLQAFFLWGKKKKSFLTVSDFSSIGYFKFELIHYSILQSHSCCRGKEQKEKPEVAEELSILKSLNPDGRCRKIPIWGACKNASKEAKRAKQDCRLLAFVKYQSVQHVL